MQVQIVGMAWFKRENYERLLSIFEDSDKLHGTYDEWLAAAENGRKFLEAKGWRVVCVDTDPDDFSKWCIAHGKNFDADARQSFANEMAFQLVLRDNSSSH